MFLFSRLYTRTWARFGVVLWLSTSISASAGCDRLLTVGWEAWRPYMYINKEGQLTGLDIDIIRALAKRMGCRLKFIKTPFKRNLQQLKTGRIDLTPAVQLMPERKAYAWYSRPYRTSAMHLIVRHGEAGQFPFHTFLELAQSRFRLGVTRGYFYGDEINTYIENDGGPLRVEQVISDELNLKKLLAARVNGILADPLVIYNLARETRQQGQIDIHPLVIHSTTFYIMGSKASVSPETMNSLNTALDTLQENGEYQTIVDRYMSDT